MAVNVYLSPHLDDAVFSCGGLIASQIAASEPVAVVTICAGDPPAEGLSPLAQELIARWGTGADASGDRRSEDHMACGRLGAAVVHLDLPDAIYRLDAEGRPLYPTEASLFGPLHPADRARVEDLAGRLQSVSPDQSVLYCPLGVGGHVDHILTRQAAESTGRPLRYYRDFPYAARGGAPPPELPAPAGHELLMPLSAEEIQTWAAAASEYRSQLSTFWGDVYALFQEIRAFHDEPGGVRLFTAR